jgi:hypothetical protein
MSKSVETGDKPAEMIRFDAITVLISAKPIEVWEFVADLNNWKQFSDFGADLEQVSDKEWIAHTPQGDVRIIPKFNREKLLLDHVCIIPSGEEQFIRYRVVPRDEGADLMLTNQQTKTVSDEDYQQQLQRMDDELNNIKKILEAKDA